MTRTGIQHHLSFLQEVGTDAASRWESGKILDLEYLLEAVVCEQRNLKHHI